MKAIFRKGFNLINFDDYSHLFLFYFFCNKIGPLFICKQSFFHVAVYCLIRWVNFVNFVETKQRKHKKFTKNTKQLFVL